MPKKRATLSDIAKIAGVTPTAVSMVFRNKPGVSKQMRQRILTLGRELQYVPLQQNTPAFEEERSEFYQLGFVSTSQDEPKLSGRGSSYLNTILNGCLSKAEELHCSVTLITASSAQIQAGVLPVALRSRQLDGLIVRSFLEPEVMEMLKAQQLPVVLLDCCRPYPMFSQININNFHGMMLLVNQLKDRGAQRLAVITGDMEHLNSQERLAGLQFHAWSAGLELPPENIIIEHGYGETSGQRGVQQLLGNGCRFDTLLGQNDLIAIGALETLRRNGLKIPQDVRLAGFDNMEFSELLPRLTGVDSQAAEMGATAVYQLYNMLRNRNSMPFQIRVMPSLVVGQTT